MIISEALGLVGQFMADHQLAATAVTIEPNHRQGEPLFEVAPRIHREAPEQISRWVTALDAHPTVRGWRRGMSEGHDLGIVLRVETEFFRWRLHWWTPMEATSPARSVWGPAFLKNVAFLRVREDRLLTPDEIDSLLAWSSSLDVAHA